MDLSRPKLFASYAQNIRSMVPSRLKAFLLADLNFIPFSHVFMNI